MAKLTIKELDALSVANIGEIIRDDGGLRGNVRANQSNKNGVSVTFVYRFRWGKSTCDFPCGTWPADSLPVIRRNRDQARILRGRRLNPIEERKLEAYAAQEATAAKLAAIEKNRSENLTLEGLIDDWLLNGVRRKDGNAELRRSFGKEVLPCIGNKPVKSVTEHDIRDILRAVVARGLNRTAVVMRNNLTQMFSWAEKRQPWRRLLSEGNPVELVEIDKIVSPDYDLHNERSRILSAEEIRELRDRFASIRSEYEAAPNKRIVTQPIERTTEIAVWLMLSTLCRVGELSMARWEHVNFDTGEWFIPRQNVKGGVADQKVYLSEFALGQFKQLQQLTGQFEWCFPAKYKEGHICVKSISKQVGDRQTMFKGTRDGSPRKPMKNRTKNANALVLANGKSGEWTPHDLRRTGSTIMQRLDIPFHVIDRCQNHVLEGSKTRRHYLHHDYADEKREAWSKLGNYLAALLNPHGNVVPLQRKVSNGTA